MKIKSDTLGMISHEMSITTILVASILSKKLAKKFDVFHEKITIASWYLGNVNPKMIDKFIEENGVVVPKKCY